MEGLEREDVYVCDCCGAMFANEEDLIEINNDYVCQGCLDDGEFRLWKSGAYTKEWLGYTIEEC